MAVTALPYNQAGLQLGLGAINFGDANPLKVMLTTSTYTPNVDTHVFKSSVNNEITGTGYTAGGKALTTVAWAYDSTNHRSVLTAAASTWTTATFTCRYGVLYKDTGTAGTSALISYIDFGANQAPVAVDFMLTYAVFASGGLFWINHV